MWYNSKLYVYILLPPKMFVRSANDTHLRVSPISKEEYISYFESYFEIKILESCYNSIKPREGNELFGLMMRG